jgi:enoyl-CoA hydratase/carnithine racemase
MMFHTKNHQIATVVIHRHCKESAMTEQVFLETTPLNALDRCDRCGAQAYVRAILLTGGQLMFCAHHGKEYAEKLKTVAAKIQDETEKLVESK